MEYLKFKEYNNLDEVIDGMSQNYYRPLYVVIHNSFAFLYNNIVTL